jgi:hypothetical protein
MENPKKSWEKETAPATPTRRSVRECEEAITYRHGGQLLGVLGGAACSRALSLDGAQRER